MPLKLLTGPANSGKARAVLDGVGAEAARGREPILVVPTAADLVLYRRELAERGLVLGVRVERFRGLVEEIAARAGVGGRTLSGLARERLAAAVAAGTRLDALAAASRTPGFARALGALVAELEGSRVTPQRLHAALEAWGRAEPRRAAYAGEVARLYEGHRRACERLGRTSVERLGGEALDRLRERPALWGGTPVLFYGFDDLTPLQLDAIETLGVRVDAPVTVSLTYEAGRLAFAGRATTFQQLAPVASEHVALPARAEHYAAQSRAVLHHVERGLFEPSAARVEAGAAVLLVEGGGQRAELELVAGQVRALIDGGTPAGEIAVVLRSPGAAAPLLGEVLRAAEIPFTLEHRVLFAHTTLGRGLLALLRCAVGDAPAHCLMRYLRAPGVVRSPGLVDRLEAAVRECGAATAAEARALWEQEHWPLERLDRVAAAAARGRGALLAQVQSEAEALFAGPRRRTAPRLGADELEDAKALAAVRAALTDLAELDGVQGLAVDGPGLIGALEALELVSGEPPRSDAVAVLDPLALRARRVRALFLCGMQEAVFPAPPRSEPFLGDEERRALAQASGLVLPRHDDSLGPERYLLYAAVSRPEELLALSWHLADDEGAPVSPSLFVDDVCDLFEPSLRAGRRRRPLGVAGWPGPGRPAAAAAAREQALRGERRPAATVGRLGPEGLRVLRGEEPVWSGSGLEAWAGCPVRWLVERGLRAEDLEPEAETLTRGTLTHAVLETTLRELREQTGSAELSPERLPVARRLLHEAIERHASEIRLSTLPERLPGARRRLEADLERYLEHACRAAGPLQPRHLEVSFGFDEDDLPALDVGEGVRIRGRIDRVDVGGDGTAIVYDYKGRNVAKPAEWISGSKFQIALYMRAVRELLGLDVVGGFYQPLGGEDLRARGVLAEESGVELDCVNGDRRPRADMERLVAEAVAAARASAAEAAQGALEPRPATCKWGGGCAYPSICRCET